jgi:hypothetical protein
MVHPSQGVRHHTKGCMALGWWLQCRDNPLEAAGSTPFYLCLSPVRGSWVVTVISPLLMRCVWRCLIKSAGTLLYRDICSVFYTTQLAQIHLFSIVHHTAGTDTSVQYCTPRSWHRYICSVLYTTQLAILENNPRELAFLANLHTKWYQKYSRLVPPSIQQLW